MELAFESPAILDSIQAGTKEQVENWKAVCRKFHNWERQEMMLKEPSSQTIACHRRSLEYLRKGTDGLISLVSAPDLIDAALLDDLKYVQDCLRFSWNYFNNPLTEPEARAILAKAFPE